MLLNPFHRASFSGATADDAGSRGNVLASGLALLVALAFAPAMPAAAQSMSLPDQQTNAPDSRGSAAGDDPGISDVTGPTYLKQPVVRPAEDSNDRARDETSDRSRPDAQRRLAPPRYVPSEFEQFVQHIVSEQLPGVDPQSIRRFGSDLIAGPQSTTDVAGQVPADYVISPGDEVALSIWGSVNADLHLSVDRSGRVNIPRVGSVLVAGIRYADLNDVLSQRVRQVFRNFQLSATLGKLRSVRIYVTGFTLHPGSYTVSSLSTIVTALMRTGGPSPAGSFRDITLMRAGKRVTTFDLYDLLLRGDKSADRVLQAEDVLQIGPLGTQVALIGSVNKPAVFELKRGETVGDVIAMAGGLAPVADTTRLSVQHLSDRNSINVVEYQLPAQAGTVPSNGDVMKAFSVVATALAIQRQNKHIRIEGEVGAPGDYILPPNSTISDAMRLAGGLSPQAYVFGTELDRESVRKTQQENYDRALRDLETDFTRATSTQHSLSADDAAAQATSAQNAQKLIERLRATRPSGRIILQLAPDARALPDMALEDGDRIYVPAYPTTVGVFGSVFNGGTYVYHANSTIDDYLRQAGGPTRGADNGSTFVVRANGGVISARQVGGDSFWSHRSALNDAPAEPGDTLFVPEELDKTTFVQGAKEWTQILYQFGIGAAALAALHSL